MDYHQYEAYFQQILASPDLPEPYDKPAYLEYTKLNWHRSSRWMKTAVINPGLEQAVKKITVAQKWIVITEPWCGDAAHSAPFIHLLSGLNPLITADYQLRDAPPFLIEQYLTNGKSKSIPKLIIRNLQGEDLAVWGPRPAACQVIYDELMASGAGFEEVKMALQKWYNEDKGNSIQHELLQLLPL